MIDCAAKGLTLVLIAIGLVICLRKASAAGRHLVWSLCAAGLLAVPLLSITLPAWQIPVPRQWFAASPGVSSTQPPTEELQTPQTNSLPSGTALSDSQGVPHAESPIRTPTAASGVPEATIVDRPLEDQFVQPGRSDVTARKPTPFQPAAASFVLWLPIVWMIGACLSMLIPAIGLWQIARLRHAATTVKDASWLRLLETHRNNLHLRRPVRLLKSPHTKMPLTWGAIRPVLLLPEEASDWSESRRTMVLLHELAHIKRFDWLAQMIGQFACALHWFNPLAWFVARRMRIEREHACDDMVLCAGTSASDYATELLHLASRLRSGSLSALAAVPMARQSAIEQRVRGILETGRRRAAITQTALLAGFLTCAGVLVPIAMLRAVPANSGPEQRYPAHVKARNLSAFSVINGDVLEYAFLYVGDLESTTQFTGNSASRAFSDIATLSFDDLQFALHRNHSMPDRLVIGGIPYVLTAGRVFIIDTITPQPNAPWQIRQMDADIPIITRENIERVFEIAHQPALLSESSLGFTGDYPRGSGRQRTIEMYSRHDGYSTRFALFHSTDDVVYDDMDSNVPADGSWKIDSTLHLDGERSYRLRCSSDEADRLGVNHQRFDLNKGRVIVVNGDGTLTQHAEFPRVIHDPEEMLRLYERINPAAEEQDKSDVVNEPEPSAEGREFVAIDLEAKATKRLADMNLLRMWRGEHTFRGVKFNVGRGVVQLGSKMFPEKPDMVVNIKVDRQFAKLHLLHATGWGGGPSVPGSPTHVEDGTLIGEYKVHYKDKTTETIPIVYGQDVCDWFFREGEEPPSRSKVAWTGSNFGAMRYGCRVRLYLSTWENPKPDNKVISIDYIGRKEETAAAPFCIAMSVENAAVPVVEVDNETARPNVQAEDRVKQPVDEPPRSDNSEQPVPDGAVEPDLSVKEAPESPNDGKVTISGRIVLEDGSPATVDGWLYYDSQNQGGGTQGNGGRYTDRFSCIVPAGTIWLSYYAEGHAPAWVGPLDLNDGSKRDDVTIVLKRGFSELVKVSNERGEPVAGATLVAHPEINDKADGPVHEHTTDANGEYVLKHLAETWYVLKITAPGYQPLRTAPLRVEAGEVLRTTMIRSQPNTGVVRFADGTPAGGSKLRAEAELTPEGKSHVFGDSGNGYWGRLFDTADVHGRFKLDQLSADSHYLFIVEALDGARAIVHDLRADQQDVQIVLPRRRDLFVRITGDLSTLRKRDGKPFISVRQRVDFAPVPGKQRYGALIGADVPIDVTEDGGTVIFRGLAVDLRSPIDQQVEVSLGNDPTTVKKVRLNLTSGTRVDFDLRAKKSEGN